MEHLLRTRVERFELADSLKLSQIEELRDRGEVESHVMPVDFVFADLPAYQAVPGDGDKLVHNGNPFPCNLAELQSAGKDQSQKIRVYDSEGMFIGVYQYEESRRRYKPLKVFLGG